MSIIFIKIHIIRGKFNLLVKLNYKKTTPTKYNIYSTGQNSKNII